MFISLAIENFWLSKIFCFTGKIKCDSPSGGSTAHIKSHYQMNDSGLVQFLQEALFTSCDCDERRVLRGQEQQVLHSQAQERRLQCLPQLKCLQPNYPLLRQ